VRILDEDTVVPPDRLRIIALYILFRYGVLQGDIKKLLLHAQLPLQDEAILYNMELLGARTSKPLKDTKSPPPPIFPSPAKPAAATADDEVLISRYEPALKRMLDEHIRGTLDPLVFPYLKPELAPAVSDANANISSASLRSAKPTWASRKLNSVEPRQRIIVFMAGGATYSEARSCYEASEQTSRDVVLVTSHMLTPGLFLRQLSDLSVDRRQLGLPVDRPSKRAPAHLYEDNAPKPAAAMQAGGLPSGPRGEGQRPVVGGGPPVDRMGAMNLNGGNAGSGSRIGLDSGSDGKLRKKEKESEADKKKKKHLWSRH
jgi:syntaxin-binding protein 1